MPTGEITGVNLLRSARFYDGYGRQILFTGKMDSSVGNLRSPARQVPGTQIEPATLFVRLTMQPRPRRNPAGKECTWFFLCQTALPLSYPG